jgi:hypothetical protein
MILTFLSVIIEVLSLCVIFASKRVQSSRFLSILMIILLDDKKAVKTEMLNIIDIRNDYQKRYHIYVYIYIYILLLLFCS